MKKRNYVIMGLLSGVVYSACVWGYDAYLLQQYNAALPWMKFLVGLLPVMLFFALVAWLSSIINNLIFRALLWMAAATGLSYLVSIFTFYGTEIILKNAFPAISSYIKYIVPVGIRSRLFVIVVMSNILFILGGLIMDSASDAMITSQGTVGWLIPVLLCLSFFAGAGYTADSNFNTELRNHIMEVDAQIQEVSELDLENLSERDSRLIRRYIKLKVDLNMPRRLVMGNFDEFFSQSEVLIKIGDSWVTCSALNGRVGTCSNISE
jgi:hypothetical protein